MTKNGEKIEEIWAILVKKRGNLGGFEEFWAILGEIGLKMGKNGGNLGDIGQKWGKLG